MLDTKTNFVDEKVEIDPKDLQVSFDNNKIKLPKLKWVKAKVHREFVGKIKKQIMILRLLKFLWEMMQKH